jgi:acyl-coenzyme A thioesterase PaaI-like protein
MDESLGRVALRSFPAGTGVTANLNIDYRARVRPYKFYYLTAKLVEDESSERKAKVVGTLTDGKGKVCVEASAIFVVPKKMTLGKITGQF